MCCPTPGQAASPSTSAERPPAHEGTSKQGGKAAPPPAVVPLTLVMYPGQGPGACFVYWLAPILLKRSTAARFSLWVQDIRVGDSRIESHRKPDPRIVGR